MHASLLKGDIPLGTFPVHDVSSGGLSVTGTIANLPYCCVLTVHLFYLDGCEPHTLETHAMVVHQRNGLIGFMWTGDIQLPVVAPGLRSESGTGYRAIG